MKIDAKVIKVLCHKDGTDWYVLSTTAGKMVGATKMPIEQGRTYSFNGKAEVYHGQLNIRFSSCAEEIPVNPLEILKYACAITKGLGPAFQRETYEAYGDDYASIIKSLTDPSEKEKKLIETIDNLALSSTRTSIISHLIELGASEKLAEDAYCKFGDATLSIVNKNIYALAEIKGQSFATIDAKFAEKLCIAKDSDVRIKSMIDYLINNIAENDGSTVVPIGKVVESVQQFGLTDSDFKKVSSIIESDFITLDEGKYVTTKKLDKIERDIYSYITSKIKPLEECNIIIPKDIVLDESQLQAVDEAISNDGNLPNIRVISGGAGCGKTTIIKTIASSLVQSEIKISICSFAGKAAARIREATGFDATTIHSMLGYRGDDAGFSNKKIDGVVIVDEASMIPSWLLSEVCKRNPSRIVLVGDEAQLPPVGAGSPFHVLVGSEKYHHATVTTCYRNREAIYSAASLIREGGAPVNSKSSNEKFSIVHVASEKEAESYICNVIPHMDFEQDVIITSRNGTAESSFATVASINYNAMKFLGVESFRTPGCRIMCTKNDPQTDVWNGTTGTVKACDIDGNVYAQIDSAGEVKLSNAYVKDAVTPAYALTIHKSQGSQYRNVLVCALRRDIATLLDRSTLYTAVTRAKSGCCVVTDMNISEIIRIIRKRNTILSTLINN